MILHVSTALAAVALLTACGSAPAGSTPNEETGSSQDASQAANVPAADAGTAFSGDLAAAIPKVVSGVPITAGAGALTEDQATAVVLDVLTKLGADLSESEFALGYDESGELGLLITALRVPGADPTALEQTFVSVQQAASGSSNFRVETLAGRQVNAWESTAGTIYAWTNGDIVFSVVAERAVAEQAIAAMPLPTVPASAGSASGEGSAGESNGDDGEFVNAEVDVTLSGGPADGPYHGEARDAGCSRDSLGENTFGLQYSTDDGNPFSSLQLIVRDAAAAAGGSDDFMATVTIGPLFEGTDFELKPGDDVGTGSVTLEDRGGDEATITIEGTTANGVQVEATITCNLVFDFGE